MNQLYLSQKLIRVILVTANVLVLAAMLATTIIPFQKIPDASFTPFVFWLFKPSILIELVLSTTVLLMGFTGATKYNKCWQGSYSFFILLLVILSVLAFLACNDIYNSLDTVIPKINDAHQYQYYIRTMAIEINCYNYTIADIEWDGEDGCKNIIFNKINKIPESCKPYTIASLVILSCYLILNVIFFIFVEDPDDGIKDFTDDKFD
ncbi:hypothetical protein TRFO_13155 [Tritrichomonas foetus]|uniref:Tetraspanin family protein n=1 Tax=Tritrichomonas foetus TaxID=1144522 RepID=A0A1J4L3N0_9EUKA|nr:hypothetical protein TRFO_13155 [Tritrichomonas foetus]|eukprot:OHT16558.1 hypothetical protein TRFO_13155 [Tritrichomonas foetus]